MNKHIIPIFTAATLLTLMFAFMGCWKRGKNVYVAGTENGVATLWKNGKPQRLGDKQSYANSVFVSGKNVYVAGSENGDATLWKNGKPQRLSDGKNGAEAFSVFVSGNDVYVAGYESNGYEYARVATVWKNGVAQRLSNAERSEANSVFVSGNDVYVAGDEDEGPGNVILWKNGVAQPLREIAYFPSVFVSGDDVYVAGAGGGVKLKGNYSFAAMLLKNGMAQGLSYGKYTEGDRIYGDDAYAFSVYVSGNDVYVAGWEEIGAPQRYDAIADRVVPEVGSRYITLWKNGVPQRLCEGERHASVFVSGEDVYVAGYEYANQGANKYFTTLWKNGVAQRLGDVTDYSPRISVFVN